MAEQITIKTAADLLGSLSHNNLSICAATIKAIVKQPDKAVSVCQENGVDLFDELVHLYHQDRDQSLRTGYVFALLSLGDQRNMAFAKDAFATTDDTRIILLVAKEIARLSQQERAIFLAPILLAGGRQTKTRAAANLLADCSNLVPELAVRIAILSDHQGAPPPVNSQTVESWIVELQGPYSLSAFKLLQEISAVGTSPLMPFWQQLPAPVLVKILRELSKQPCKEEGERIRAIIRDATGDVLLWALKCLQQLPSQEGDHDIIDPLCRHNDPAVRAAAISSGRTQLDWSMLLASEPDEEVRLSIISRIQRCQDAAAIRLLVSLMQDSSWRIRARATTALVALAPKSLEWLQDMLSHPEDRVRASACQALNALGQEELIREVFEV